MKSMVPHIFSSVDDNQNSSGKIHRLFLDPGDSP